MNGNGARDDRPLKVRMREAAKAENGRVVMSAATAAALAANLSVADARQYAYEAMMQSLITPVVMSAYEDLSDDIVEMLAEGRKPELITDSPYRGGVFDPSATKYNFGALVGLLFPLIQPVIEKNSANFAYATAAMIAGIIALWPTLKTQVTGIDAELVVELGRYASPGRTSPMPESDLFMHVNNDRAARYDAPLPLAEFKESISRLVAYGFFHQDNGSNSVRFTH